MENNDKVHEEQQPVTPIDAQVTGVWTQYNSLRRASGTPCSVSPASSESVLMRSLQLIPRFRSKPIRQDKLCCIHKRSAPREPFLIVQPEILCSVSPADLICLQEQSMHHADSRPARLFRETVCVPITAPPPTQCPPGRCFTVQPGDSMFTIAQRFGVSLNALIAANPQSNQTSFSPGKLCACQRGPTMSAWNIHTRSGGRFHV